MTWAAMAPNISEADVGRACDAFVKTCAGDVVNYSQAQKAQQTLGIPDREYLIFGGRIRMELKAPDGKLTEDQFRLLEKFHGAGDVVCCGGLEELQHTAVALRREKVQARALGWLFVRLWAAKGFRRVKSQKQVSHKNRG